MKAEVALGHVELVHVKGDKQKADGMTKQLGKLQFQAFQKEIVQA